MGEDGLEGVDLLELGSLGEEVLEVCEGDTEGGQLVDGHLGGLWELFVCA